MWQLLGPYNSNTLKKTVKQRLNQFSYDCIFSRGYFQWWYSTPYSKKQFPQEIDENDRGYGWITSKTWQEALDAQDNPKQWLQIGEQVIAEEQFIEASIAIAAANWLIPSTPESLKFVNLLKNKLPEHEDMSQASSQLQRLENNQIKEKFHMRHWIAWAMKESPLNLYIPNLLTDECDENFSLRTRIYRSLGQAPHPAAIQCLQEATRDPHPFARAQAIRSLGWIGDPSFIDPLIQISEEDPIADVRRIAAKTLQRVAGYWMFYGEWKDILLSADRLYETIDILIEVGLAIFASDFSYVLYSDEFKDNPPDDEWIKRFQAVIDEYSFLGDSGRYYDFFEEADKLEMTIEWPVERDEANRAVEIKNVGERLNCGVKEQQMQGLYQVSRRDLKEFLPDIEKFVLSLDKDLAWNARRALRKLERGTLSQRRVQSSSWH
ncbi:MAG: HEAT repeat domain-containing protein [Deltaproteobacteria bacterium]|nr:HEAT repeat domain-containing protein [Deltaproteobacteria bacterium]